MHLLPKISFKKILCPAVSPCLLLCPAGTRCVPLDTTTDLGRCHTDAPPWPPWIPRTTPCSKRSSATGGDARSTTSWRKATAAGGAAVPSGYVASSSPVVRVVLPRSDGHLELQVQQQSAGTGKAYDGISSVRVGAGRGMNC